MKVLEDKNQARTEFIKMTLESWTYEKMTNAEQIDIILKLTLLQVKGTYFQRWEQLQNEYKSFLASIGYKPLNWRNKTNNVE